MKTNVAKQTNDSSTLLVAILTVGVFGIINTEMGIVGILPLIAETFQVSVPQAGWTVSAFALVANIIGNILAGKWLSINANRCIAIIPLLLLPIYVCVFIAGEWVVTMIAVILALGILAGVMSNAMQYMITHAAPEAPDFANGMFLTSANLGTTIGTAVCGIFITDMGTRYSVLGALFFLSVSLIFVYLWRNRVLIKKEYTTSN